MIETHAHVASSSSRTRIPPIYPTLRTLGGPGVTAVRRALKYIRQCGAAMAVAGLRESALSWRVRMTDPNCWGWVQRSGST